MNEGLTRFHLPDYAVHGNSNHIRIKSGPIMATIREWLVSRMIFCCPSPRNSCLTSLLTPGKTQQSIQRGQRIETDMVTFGQKCPVPCRTELGQCLQHIFPRAAQQLQ
ncbi:Uncharacterised protein [Klebsiella quasipneumoniae]|nr:Uncharacterised protein [Klebsiella grimontii]SCA39807.1 Uncharacterised protein [Klebsiella quasipneumoniae]SCA40074.1 Uncharacterised protein [Klebsiella quasipneumoniae]